MAERVNNIADREQAGEEPVFRFLANTVLVVSAVLTVFYIVLVSAGPVLVSNSAHHRMVVQDGFFRDFTPTAGKQVVLAVGDSISMSAFNGYAFDEMAADEQVESYNIGLSALTMPEYLVTSSQPVFDDAVVVMFGSPLTSFLGLMVNVHPHRANIYGLLNYEYDRGPVRRFTELVPESNAGYLLKPRIVHVLESRWLLRNTILRSFHPLAKTSRAVLTGEPAGTNRRVLRPFDYDMKYPDIKASITGERLDRHLLEITADLPAFDGGFSPSPEMAAGYDYVISTMDSRSRKLVLVLAPLHPRIKEYLGDRCIAEWREFARRYEDQGVQVIDMIDLLDAEDFRDVTHVATHGSYAVINELICNVEFNEPAGGG